MPSTTFKRVRGAIRRPEYSVLLELPGGRRHYRIEASTLNELADVIQREVEHVYPTEHVGVRLDPDGGVYVRLGWAPSQPAGTWESAVSS